MFFARLIVLLAWWAWILPSEGMAGEGARASASAQDEENRRFFTDLKVITHEGQELRFYSDLLKDKVVLVSFFYINCPTAQPVLTTNFRLQGMLEERLGKELFLLTISVDPEKDGPDAIREFAGKFNPRPGWLFLTGKKENMDVINRKLGNTLALPEGHLRMFLLGNPRTGHWMKLPETAPPMGVADGLRALLAEGRE